MCVLCTRGGSGEGGSSKFLLRCCSPPPLDVATVVFIPLGEGSGERELDILQRQRVLSSSAAASSASV